MVSKSPHLPVSSYWWLGFNIRILMGYKHSDHVTLFAFFQHFPSASVTPSSDLWLLTSVDWSSVWVPVPCGLEYNLWQKPGPTWSSSREYVACHCLKSYFRCFLTSFIIFQREMSLVSVTLSCLQVEVLLGSLCFSHLIVYIYIYTHTHTYTYMYICMRICVDIHIPFFPTPCIKTM
jgi:hypothetical protein